MTHTERVLELLSDGQPHSHHEGYRLGVMLHSRVADLRRKGYAIDCWRSAGIYLYQLRSLPQPDRDDVPLSPAPVASGSGSERGVVDQDVTGSARNYRVNEPEGRSLIASPGDRPVRRAPSPLPEPKPNDRREKTSASHESTQVALDKGFGSGSGQMDLFRDQVTA